MNKAVHLEKGQAAKARLFRAPGRANIIGEHTDYNDGLVLPTNTGLYTWVRISPRNDRLVSVCSDKFGADQTFDLDDIETSGPPTWVDYIAGVCAELEIEGIVLCGADITIKGDIPLGGGLSSSASLELATALAMLSIVRQDMSRPTLARICQRAERNFVGVQCGIMDQYSVACCPPGQALLLDCQSLAHRCVDIPTEIRFLLTDSGVKHQHAESGYNQRAQECREAVAVIRRGEERIKSLRDVSSADLDASKEQLGDVLYRRSRHVVTEIQRTQDAFEVLASQDAGDIGDLISESHASLRDDFEISCDEIESLVAIADHTAGVLGSRMVGGGFGGCVLSVVRAEKIDTASQTISQRYAEVTGEIPWTHVVSPAQPVQEVIGQ